MKRELAVSKGMLSLFVQLWLKDMQMPRPAKAKRDFVEEQGRDDCKPIECHH